jgi:hypothetical protein
VHRQWGATHGLGAPSDSLLLLRSGELCTEVTIENDAPVTVARFGVTAVISAE